MKRYVASSSPQTLEPVAALATSEAVFDQSSIQYSFDFSNLTEQVVDMYVLAYTDDTATGIPTSSSRITVNVVKQSPCGTETISVTEKAKANFVYDLYEAATIRPTDYFEWQSSDPNCPVQHIVIT